MQKMAEKLQQVEDEQLQPQLSKQQLFPPDNKCNVSKGEDILGVWDMGANAPHPIAGPGAAIVDEKMGRAYFMDINGVIYSYLYNSDEWNRLKDSPYQCSSLAILKGLITVIGGLQKTNKKPKRKLLSITDIEGKDTWVKYFRPMPTKRHSASAVQTELNLIVAGGKNQSSCLDTVEVMAIETEIWSTLANLPKPYCMASAAICGDYMYILGGDSASGCTKSVFECSLSKLLPSSIASEKQDKIWSEIKDAPMHYSTCLAIEGEVLAIGGIDDTNKTTTSIYKYNKGLDSWEMTSNMKSPLYHRLFVVLQSNGNKLIAVGGKLLLPTMKEPELTDKVEIANILL